MKVKSIKTLKTQKRLLNKSIMNLILIEDVC